MGAIFIAVLMMALAGGYALLRGHLGITDRLVLNGWRARLTGGLWLLPLAALLILWSLPGDETAAAYWPLVVMGTVIAAIVLITLTNK